MEPNISFGALASSWASVRMGIAKRASGITELVKVVDEEMDGIASEQRKRLRIIDDELEDVKRKLDRIWNAIETSDIDIADASDRIKEHRERKETLEIAPEDARAILSEHRAHLDDVKTISAYAKDMRDFLNESELTVEARRSDLTSSYGGALTSPGAAASVLTRGPAPRHRPQTLGYKLRNNEIRHTVRLLAQVGIPKTVGCHAVAAAFYFSQRTILEIFRQPHWTIADLADVARKRLEPSFHAYLHAPDSEARFFQSLMSEFAAARDSISDVPPLLPLPPSQPPDDSKLWKKDPLGWTYIAGGSKEEQLDALVRALSGKPE